MSELPQHETYRPQGSLAAQGRSKVGVCSRRFGRHLVRGFGMGQSWGPSINYPPVWRRMEMLVNTAREERVTGLGLDVERSKRATLQHTNYD